MSLLDNIRRFAVPDSNYGDAENEAVEEEYSYNTPSDNFSQTRVFSANRQILVFAPSEFSHCKIICERFRMEHAIILDMEGVDIALVNRILDYFAGVADALDGGVFKISETAFALAPRSVSVEEVILGAPETESA